MTSDAPRPRARLAAFLIGLGPALLPSACPAAAAEPLRAVVELYTSQGCAVCPPADQMLGELARRPGILALTFPVTYWDYLGWKDTLALAPFSERQRAYASAHGERQVYTPQAVVNGGAVAVASDRPNVERILREARALNILRVPVASEEHGERIVVEIGGDADPAARGEVWLIPVLRNRPVSVERGENKGRVVVYVNVARGLHRLGTWTGQPARFEALRSAARIGEADTYVIVVQSAAGGRPGRIWGAAKGPGL
jgi:hypothetical protein